MGNFVCSYAIRHIDRSGYGKSIGYPIHRLYFANREHQAQIRTAISQGLGFKRSDKLTTIDYELVAYVSTTLKGIVRVIYSGNRCGIRTCVGCGVIHVG